MLARFKRWRAERAYLNALVESTEETCKAAWVKASPLCRKMYKNKARAYFDRSLLRWSPETDIGLFMLKHKMTLELRHTGPDSFVNWLNARRKAKGKSLLSNRELLEESSWIEYP